MLSVLLFINCSGGGGGTSAPLISLSSAKDITAFSIMGRIGIISGNTISVTVPEGTSRVALVATFTTSGVSVRVGGTIQKSGVTPNNFTSPVAYIVTAQDSSTKTYTVTVTVAPPAPLPSADIIAGHAAAANFNIIPAAQIVAAKANLHIAYGHTSHGSQIVTGMTALANDNSLYAWNEGGTGGALDLRDYAMSGDLGNPDFTSWATETRTYLGTVNASGRGVNHPEINVIIWSWCGQVSGASEANINTYLSLMNQLETDYPGIKFVYMTGHLDGSGASGNLNVRNQQIRDYCIANHKALFDFADIESYDPSGSEFLTRGADDGCNYDSGNWATQWIAANPGHVLTNLASTICTDCCAHSRPLNCILKGRAAWWLWARLAGWNGNP